jgi:hypothetical protein
VKNPLKNGTLIALTAASLFAAACSKKSDTPSAGMSADKTAKIHCQGANECKGKSACKSAVNACAGQNGCKGKGFVETASADECTAHGGTVAAN